MPATVVCVTRVSDTDPTSVAPSGVPRRREFRGSTAGLRGHADQSPSASPPDSSRHPKGMSRRHLTRQGNCVVEAISTPRTCPRQGGNPSLVYLDHFKGEGEKPFEQNCRRDHGGYRGQAQDQPVPWTEIALDHQEPDYSQAEGRGELFHPPS